MMVLSPETIAALRPAQTETTPSLTGSDKVVLGKAATTDGTLKRPEYFAAGDVGDFQRHEAALSALEATDKAVNDKEFLRLYRALPETARSLVEVPVYPADLARNHCASTFSRPSPTASRRRATISSGKVRFCQSTERAQSRDSRIGSERSRLQSCDRAASSAQDLRSAWWTAA